MELSRYLASDNDKLLTQQQAAMHNWSIKAERLSVKLGAAMNNLAFRLYMICSATWRRRPDYYARFITTFDWSSHLVCCA